MIADRFRIGNCPVSIFQYPGELRRLLAIYRALQPQTVLEIGALYGGTLWHWMKNAPGATVISVDLPVGIYDFRRNDVLAARALWSGWAREFGCTLIDLAGHSQNPDIFAQVNGFAPLDFVFVDGDHSFAGVDGDFRLYAPLVRPGGVMAFH